MLVVLGIVEVACVIVAMIVSNLKKRKAAQSDVFHDPADPPNSVLQRQAQDVGLPFSHREKVARSAV